jgi:hypothetical protein
MPDPHATVSYSPQPCSCWCSSLTARAGEAAPTRRPVPRRAGVALGGRGDGTAGDELHQHRWCAHPPARHHAHVFSSPLRVHGLGMHRAGVRLWGRGACRARWVSRASRGCWTTAAVRSRRCPAPSWPPPAPEASMGIRSVRLVNSDWSRDISVAL